MLKRIGDGLVVARSVTIADRWWLRAVGLLGCSAFPDDQALWLNPCRAIHTFNMAFAIDAVFVDPELRIVRCALAIRPWRWRCGGSGASSVFEFAAGSVTVARLKAGDRLAVERNPGG